MKPFRVFFGLGLLVSLVQAQAVRMSTLYAGGKAGESVYERRADGTFTSRTSLTLGTIKLQTSVQGKYEGKRIVSYEAEQDIPGQGTMKLVFDGKALKATVGGKTTDVPVGDIGETYFGNLHPQFVASALRAVDASKRSEQKVNAYGVDLGVKVDLKITPLPPKTVTGAGTAQMYKLALGTVIVEYALDAQGRVVGMDVPSQKIRFVAEGWDALYVDPLAAYPELSQPTFAVKTEKSVKMRTRDGVELAMDVVRPAAEGKYPTILIRTPYGRGAGAVEGDFWARRGYVLVAQDARGREESGGEWDPFVHEGADGADTLSWIAAQPWSDGKVGMIGASYGGYVQWAAAVEGHPALKCIVPQVSPPDAMRNLPYDHGVFFLYGSTWWAKIVAERGGVDLSSMGSALPNARAFTTLPLSKVDDAVLGRNVPFFDRWLERDTMPEWRGFDFHRRIAQVRIPVLHISGWWDGDAIGTKLNWEALRRAGHRRQWLLYGPWTHAFNTTSSLGDVDYGPGAILELDSLYLRWFDTWLKGKDVGLGKVPRARFFVTGANRWVEDADWPAPKSTARTLYLSADAPANGKTSRGRLVSRPAREQEPSRYTFNPANDEIDKRFLEMDAAKATTVVEFPEADQDVLLYKTDPLPRAMAIAGPLEVELRFNSTARDTDFFAMLVDVDEKGVMRAIGQPGKVRASYLQGYDRQRPLTPGKTYTARIALWDLAHEFKTGHRLGLMVMPSMFPVFARNLGTAEPIKDAVRMVTQSQTIFHDARRPSLLRFRVLWEGEGR